MSFQPTPKQALVLWTLLITGEEPAISNVKPDLKASERRPLLDAGLIELVKQGRSQRIVLTDKAWDWAAENFETELSKSNFAVPVLEALLKQLGAYFKRRQISLAEFLSGQDALEEELEPVAAAPPDFTELASRIRAAYLEASGGEYMVRVRLAHLRRLLADIPREMLDQALIEMSRLGKIVPMRLDDPQEINPEDEKAALNFGGEKKYIVYLKEW